MHSATDETDGVEDRHFHPIANSRAHEEVIEQIIFAILSGAYTAGMRLPNIEALSRMMGVSRPVVGEALKILAQASVVRPLRGVNGGLMVETNNVPDRIMALAGPLRHFALPDILEARRPIELQIALKAAERATESDFVAMQLCIDNLKTHRASELALRIRYDHQFHYSMGRAARSSTLALYQHQILEHLFVRMRAYFTEIEDVDSVIALHEETLDALRSGDAAKIGHAIDVHLRPLEEAVLASAA
jgi:DNA-binding FadR family transcriptional regulator